MNRKTAIKCIDFIFNHRLKTEDHKRPIVLNITGGEPLLRFDLLTLIVDKLYEKAGKYKLPAPYVEISTNATLLRQEHIEYLADKNYSLYIGFDGMPESHDTNRILFLDENGSYNQAFGNIKKFCLEDKAVKPRTTLNMVVSPNNVSFLFDNLVRVYGLLDGKNISVNIAVEQAWDDRSLEMLGRELNRVADFYIEIITTVDKNFYIKMINDQITRSINNSGFSPGKCGAATDCYAISTNGNIYACGGFSFTGIKEKNITLGNVDEGLKPDLIEKFRQEAFSLVLDDCADCGYINKCFFYCPANNYLATKSMTEISYNQCEINKRLIAAADYIIDELYTSHKALFMERFLGVSPETVMKKG